MILNTFHINQKYNRLDALEAQFLLTSIIHEQIPDFKSQMKYTSEKNTAIRYENNDWNICSVPKRNTIVIAEL